MVDVRGRWQRSVMPRLLLALVPDFAAAQSSDAVRALAQREKPPRLDTLKALVEIESGTADVEGVTRIGALIAERLRGLGGRVDLVPPAADWRRITSLPQQFAETVVARFHGRGARHRARPGAVVRRSDPGRERSLDDRGQLGGVGFVGLGPPPETEQACVACTALNERGAQGYRAIWAAVGPGHRFERRNGSDPRGLPAVAGAAANPGDDQIG